MKTTLAIFTTIIMIVAPNISAAQSQTNGKPNLLLIMADDLGFSDIGAFGGEISTPNLDRIAAEGVRLTNFYTAATCSPTRAMLMSGVDNHLSGVGNMKELAASNQMGMPGYEGYLNDRVVTLAELLKKAGYATSITGKWHLGAEIDQSPKVRGFDRSFVQVVGAGDHFGGRLLVPHQILSRTPPVAEWRADGHAIRDFGDDFYSSEVIAEKMMEFIHEKKRRKPFFAFLSFTAPHWPLQARDDYMAKYAGRYDKGYDAVRAARFARQKELGIVGEGLLPPRAPGVPSWESLNAEQKRQSAKRMEIYAAMIDSMDANIGRVLSFLERRGELENTIIIFLSDNGAADSFEQHPMMASATSLYDNNFENLGKKGSFAAYGPGWGQVSNTPFSGYKMRGMEGGVHVPAIIRTPRGDRAGVNDETVLTVKDILPTLVEAAGGKLPDGKFKGREVVTPSGVSFLALARGETSEFVRPKNYIATEIAGTRALRHGDWKLVGRAAPGAGAATQWKMFNLAVDPSELDDLSSKETEKLQNLIDLWTEYEVENGYIHAKDFPFKLPPPRRAPK